MKAKLIYVGLGALGVKVVRDLVDQNLHELACAVDPAPRLQGVSLADAVPGAPDVPIYASLRDVPNLSSMDLAVVTTLSELPACMPTFRTLLEAGCSVLSTCEELVYPQLRYPDLANELSALARLHQCAVMGTGINPGFLMDAFPLFASALCRSISSIKVERVQDASIRRIPFQKKIGAGCTPAQFHEALSGGGFGHVGLGESLHLLAQGLGVELDQWQEVISPVLATEPMECGFGAIPTGGVTGIHQVARGQKDGRCLIELTFHAAIGAENPRDRVIIDGDPPIEVSWGGGVHGDKTTSAVVINAVSSLLKAPAGLHNLTTLPGAPCKRVVD